jgi:4-hydroxy-tetrahydrodipicolinate synthase
MAAPPPGSSANDALREHFRRIGDGLGAPVVVQDHPASSGVKLPVPFLASLAETLPPHSVVKLEDPPTSVKIAELRARTDAFAIFGGSGGLYLLPELEAGAAGVMTGFGQIETLVRIVGEHRAGDRDAARRSFAEALPLMLLESQPGIAAGIRKEILRRRGAIRHATVRQPAPPLSATTIAELDALLGRKAEGGPPPSALRPPPSSRRHPCPPSGEDSSPARS